MISHREAEALISARLDQQLDPLVERELAAHLATCAQCRAFARSTEVLASGLRELPYLPASPDVSRRVMARVDEGRSPWANFGGFLANPGPALSTLAVIAVVLVLGFFVLNRFVLDSDRGSDNDHLQLASQPTVVTQSPESPKVISSPLPTATSEPTATTAPTQTTAPEPTATTAPTATSEPTATTAPTQTTAPEPTATTVPTQTTAPEPTATDVPVVQKQETESTPEAVTRTAEPTATHPPEVTATIPPESTSTPDVENTPATSDDTGESPPIEAINGREVVQAPEDVAATATAAVNAPEPTVPPVESPESEVPIQPINRGDGTGDQVIEPIDGTVVGSTPSPETATGEAGESESTPPEGQPTQTAVDNDALSLDEHSDVYGDIAGDPSGRLVLDGGRMEYQPSAHPPVLTSIDGLTASTTATDGGQAVTLCSGDTCTNVSSESADGPATDTPLSWNNGTLLYARNASGAITYHALVPDESGMAAASDTILYDGGGALAPTSQVYSAEGQVWVITEGAGWLALTGETAHLYDVSYTNPQLVRFAETGEGTIVAYVADGRVIVALTDAPGSPIGSAPFAGVDFDISPGGNRIAISTGSAIEIYDLGGTRISVYASPDMQPGSVLWLNSGIVFHDSASGVLMQIPDPRTE